MALERLQKIIARAGVDSRRHAERLIVEGRVRVDGRICSTLGSKADPRRERIEVEGIGVLRAEPKAYILLHKPPMVVSTAHDPEQRPTVLTVLEGSRAQGRRMYEGELPRLYPVGRLDFDAEGAILLTNDGELAQTLMKPKSLVPKVYVVKVRGRITDAALAELRGGLYLPPERPFERGVRTRPAEAKRVSEGPKNSWIELTLFEGKNHQVKRMCQAVGYECIRLVRTEFAGLELGPLPTGAWRHVNPAELASLRRWSQPA